MIYEFKTPKGEIVEAHYPAGKAPEVGAWLMVDTVCGRRLRAQRVLSVPGAVKGDNWKPYKSARLSPNIPGVRTHEGQVVVETRAEENNIAAKLGGWKRD